MNTRRNKIVVTLCAVLALAFSSCSEREAEDLKTGVTPSDIQIQTVSYTNEDGVLNGSVESKSNVTFTINVKNLGGLDLNGATVQAYIDNKPAGFTKTGELASVLEEGSEKTVTINWEAVAGAHSAVFYIANDTASYKDDGNKRIDLAVAVADIKIENVEEVEVSVGADKIKALVTTTEDQTPAEVVENVDALIAASADKSENEVAVLKTIKTIADDNLTIADAAPTQISFEDKTVDALLLPLAKVVENPITGEKETVVEEGSFLVSITTVVEEVTASEMNSDGKLVPVGLPSKKNVTVPVAVKRDETSGSTAFKNSLGGFTVAKGGAISVSRADLDFWAVLAKELAVPAQALASVLDNADNSADKLDAMAVFIGKMTSAIVAYDLQSQVTNDKPQIAIAAKTKMYSVKEGNDRLDISYDVYTATVSDDKDGAALGNGEESQVFDPGTSASLADRTFKFVAKDVEGEETSVTVVSKYTVQRIVDYYAHDQGGVN